MDAENFVKSFYIEKESLLEEYFSKGSKTQVAELIKSLDLDDKNFEILLKIMNTSFSDIFYTLLLGLDGSASIGGEHQVYDIKDEEGNQLSGKGIEGYAYEYFQTEEIN